MQHDASVKTGRPLGVELGSGAERLLSLPGRAAPQGTGGAGRSRILYAEDDACVREVTTRILRRAGHAVTPVKDGAAAWDALEAACSRHGIRCDAHPRSWASDRFYERVVRDAVVVS